MKKNLLLSCWKQRNEFLNRSLVRSFCSHPLDKNNFKNLFAPSEADKERRKEMEKERKLENEGFAYRLEDIDVKAVEKLKSLNQDSKLISEYTFLLRSLREKLRLTVDWTDIRDDDKAAIKRVATRVGFKIDD